MKTKFKYEDRVKVIDGFWTGWEGYVTNCENDYDTFKILEYEVLISKDGVHKEIYVPENWLKKIK